MIQTYTIYGPSKTKGKKYDVYVENGGSIKRVAFGALGYQDYTIHHDENRKFNYIRRHQHDRLDDPRYPGFWSMWVLWNKPTIKASLKDIKRHYGFKSKPITAPEF